MNTQQITCDHCGNDLTQRGIPWLVLRSEPMHIDPETDQPNHFCGLRCLHGWVNAHVTVTRKYEPNGSVTQAIIVDGVIRDIALTAPPPIIARGSGYKGP